ncbi:MAG: hypothetical protein ACQEVA_09965 [Myxococcota bacterium]
MRKLRAIAVVLLLSMVVAGCGDSGGSGGGPTDSDNVPSDDVRVMDESARQSLSAFDFQVDQNQGEMRFDASNSFAQSIQQGNILASEPIDGPAPAGLLQRVQSVSEEGDTIVVTTRQATLVESFERADFEGRREINPDDVEQAQSLRRGVSFQTLEGEEARGRQGLGQPFELSFDQTLVESGQSEVTLNGDVRFSMAFDTALRIQPPSLTEGARLQRFLFAVDLDQSANVEVTGDIDETIDESQEVQSIDIQTITFSVGPVPVVIDIDLVLSIGLNGEITAQLEASASQSSDLRVGAEYTGGDGWSNIRDRSGNVNVDPPNFNADAQARVWARAQLELLIYGITGPFVFAEPYLRLEAELYTSPYWELFNGLDAGVGFLVELPIVGEVANHEATANVFENQTAESSNRAPSLEIISPSDGTTVTAGNDLTLTVSAFDREDREVDVRIQNDDVSGSTTVAEGGESQLTTSSLCEGVTDLTVVAEDDDGATDTKTISVVAENAQPAVTLDDSLLTTDLVFPGAFISATASVTDSRCASAPDVDEDRTRWFVDGTQVARTKTLGYRLPAAQYSAGDTVQVEARFDDGGEVGSDSTSVTLGAVPSGDVPIEASINSCNICEFGTVWGGAYSVDTIEVSGIAFDPKEGELSGSQLVWELEEPDGTRSQFGTGADASLDLENHYSGRYTDSFGVNTVILTATSGSETVSVSANFEVTVAG